MSLKPVLEALDKIAAVSGKKDKLALIDESKEIPYFRKVALYAYDHERRFNTTDIPDQSNGILSGDVDAAFQYLDLLADKNGASDLEIDALSKLTCVDTETVEVFRRIVKKDLRCGASLKSFKTIEPNLKEYNPMAAKGSKDIEKDFARFMKAANNDYSNVSWSVKMDGVRVSYANVYENNTVEYLSRSGKKWLNFGCCDDELIRAAQTVRDRFNLAWPIQFDGEVVTTDTDFQKVMGEVRRFKDVDTDTLRFVVWGIFSTEHTIEESYHLLGDLFPTTTGTHDDFMTTCANVGITNKVFRLYQEFDHGWTCTDDMINTCKNIVAGGDEGLVAKINNSYPEDKRSVNWYKCKALYIKGEGIEVDLPVLRWVHGKKGTKYENMMGKLICDYNGVEVGVGSGFDDEQRQRYMSETPRWIEVHADSETKDGSLRLPIFQRARDDK